MSEQNQQDRINEALSLLGRMTPAALAANRDELFFRAGEASARGELAASSAWRHRVWPAIAATLALVAGGLGYSVVNRQPQVEVVYVERPTAKTNRDTGGGAKVAQSSPAHQESLSDEAGAWRYAGNPARLVPESDIIHRQDWAALSDAFAQQLRLQQERHQNLHSAAMAAADQSPERSPGGLPRERGRNYLELRDALREM